MPIPISAHLNASPRSLNNLNQVPFSSILEVGAADTCPAHPDLGVRLHSNPLPGDMNILHSMVIKRFRWMLLVSAHQHLNTCGWLIEVVQTRNCWLQSKSAVMSGSGRHPRAWRASHFPPGLGPLLFTAGAVSSEVRRLRNTLYTRLIRNR